MSANRNESLQTLRPGQLHLWIALTADPDDTIAISPLALFLSEDERNEARRFHRATDQHQFIIARSLLRVALSHHLPVPASDWRFDRCHNGRPFVTAPEISAAVHFSVSHTEGLIACLISSSAEAAVDVEKVGNNRGLALVARQILSPAELRTLSVLSGEAWTARFFDFWTLKEAYAKARSLGLNLTLSDIGFELESDNTIRAYFASKVNDDASAWKFWLRHLSSQHTLSVAAKRGVGDRCEIILRSVKLDGLNSVSNQSGGPSPTPTMSTPSRQWSSPPVS